MRHCVRPDLKTLFTAAEVVFGHNYSIQLFRRSVILKAKKTNWIFVSCASRHVFFFFFFFYSDLSGEVWLFMKETGQNFSSSSQRLWYQQPVTSTLQLKELRCKEPSLSALSEGHQRLRWSESAAALMVWVSPLSLQKNLFVLRMFADPGEDKQPVSCL